MPQRLAQINNWLQTKLGLPEYDIQPASSDASFRRYFRITCKAGNFNQYASAASLIVMDAPPSHENVQPFIRVSGDMKQMGLNVPVVFEQNIEEGILLLSDLGAVQYLTVLDDNNVERLYGDALAALYRLQLNGPRQSDYYPSYDQALLQRELGIFSEWYLEKHLGLRISDDQREVIDSSFTLFIESALEQPTVLVHRDYHSRNLMLTESGNPGILDFQDAVIGPITYDLVSLLKDCYIKWPKDKVENWCLQHKQKLENEGIIDSVSDHVFLRWFDFMGAQRHLKATGIFARLDHRDGKPDYLNDIPRTLSYVYDVACRYSELHGLKDLLVSVNPKLATNT